MQNFYSKNKQQQRKRSRKKRIRVYWKVLLRKEKKFQLITTSHSQGNQRKSDFHVTMDKPTMT